MRDTLDLSLCIDHRVDREAGLLVPGARLAEVEASEQLADEEDVDSCDDFGLEHRVICERVEGEAGAEVGEAAERGANVEQAGLGAGGGRKVVELVVTDGAEQNGVGGEREVEGRRGQGSAVGGDGYSAEQAFGKGEVVAAELGYRFEDADGFVGDFGADAVSGA